MSRLRCYGFCWSMLMTFLALLFADTFAEVVALSAIVGAANLGGFVEGMERARELSR